MTDNEAAQEFRSEWWIVLFVMMFFLLSFDTQFYGEEKNADAEE